MAVITAATISLALWGCEESISVTPRVEIPTIGIMEPEFDAKTMNVTVLIAPSSDATA